MSIDYTTDLGRVRLLIPDTDEATGLIFTDAQITAFLTLEGQIVKRAAAAAIEAIASSEVMVSKVIRSQDLQTDGAKVSDALLKRAAELRRQADEDDPATGFDIVDFRDPDTLIWSDHELAEPEWWC